MLIPKVVYIETTNLCNADCIMCPHNKITREPGFMSDRIFYKIIADCKKNNIKNTQIFFHKEGEPLLDKKLFERIKYAKKEIGKGNEIGINTNGMLLLKDKAVKLIESGLDTIYFSIDGTDKEKYEEIRRNLDYDVVINNVKNFFRIKEELGSSIRVIMQMLTLEDNSQEEKIFKKLWQDYPCEFYIKRMHSYLDGGNSSLTKELEKKQLKVCEDPFKIVVIYTNGEVGLCCWDYNNEYSLGNILEKDLFSIFNDKKAILMREKQINLDCNNIVPCNRCRRIFGNDLISKY